MQEDSFRGFVALPVQTGIKAFLQSFRAEAIKSFPDYRFVQTENLHITLQFLGNGVRRSLVPEIRDVIQTSAARTPGFSISLGEASAFPEKGLPRVLYIGIGHGKTEIIKLARDLRAGLARLGFHDNKPFRTHITLARRKERAGSSYSSSNEDLWAQSFSDFKKGYLHKFGNNPELHWQASEVFLMDSQLTPKGPVYSVLASFPFPGQE